MIRGYPILLFGDQKHSSVLVHALAMRALTQDIVLVLEQKEKEFTLPPCDPMEILPGLEKTIKGGAALWRPEKKNRKIIPSVPIRQGTFFLDQRRGYRGFRRF